MNTFVSAGFWARLAALMVDTFMILFPITIALTVVFGYTEMKTSKPMIAGVIQMTIYGAIVIWCWVKKGYTPGKKLLRLIVIDDRTGKTIGFMQALWRFLAVFVSIISVIGLLLPIVRKDKKTLHDLLSRTRVIRI
ncbi:MAG: RDD family protein [Helicobacteraceae bacterium]|jgi:uncharacterized RDD family membrane protein YckC|nr:RDD family protein [Helicobacteraceae bacterium]